MGAIRGAMIALAITAGMAVVCVIAYYLWEWLL